MEFLEKLEEMGKAFSEYQKAINVKMETLEKGQSTAEVDLKISNIVDNYAALKQSVDETKASNDAMLESLASLNRQGLVTGEARKELEMLNTFAKQAHDGEKQLGKFAVNTWQTDVNTDGGYVVLPDVEKAIYNHARNGSNVRGLCTVKVIGGSHYEVPVGKDACTVNWTGENGTMSNTGTPTIEMVKIPVGTLYAFPKATLEMIQDSYLNVAGELMDSAGIGISEAENAAFTTGEGLKGAPKGFLKYTLVTTADSTRGIADVQYVATGASGAFAANPAGWQSLYNLVFALKAAYRANAVWQMNSLTLCTILKIATTTDKQPIWQPSLQAGVPDKLLGYDTSFNEDMPDIAANSLSIAFGDFKRGYVITEKPGVYLEFDPYTARPLMQWDMRKRVGGGLRDTSAVKVMKFASS